MNLTPELKAEIDALSLEDLLRRWRFHSLGAEPFQGESGDYYASRLAEVRSADPAGWTAASKAVGWGS